MRLPAAAGPRPCCCRRVSPAAALEARATKSAALLRGPRRSVAASISAEAEAAPAPTIDGPDQRRRRAVRRFVLVRHGQSTWNAEGRIQGSSDVSVLTEKGKRQAGEAAQLVREHRFTWGSESQLALRFPLHLVLFRPLLSLSLFSTSPSAPSPQFSQLSRELFDAMAHSPLDRAVETASIIWAANEAAKERKSGGRPGAPPPAVAALPSLREIDLHSFQGLLKSEGFSGGHAAAYARWKTDPEAFEIDGRLPVRDLWERAGVAWRELLEALEAGAAAPRPAAPAPRSPPPPPPARAPPPPPPPPRLLVVAHNAVNQALVASALGLPPRAFRRLPQSNGCVTELELELEPPSPPPPPPRAEGGEGRELPACSAPPPPPPSSPPPAASATVLRLNVGPRLELREAGAGTGAALVVLVSLGGEGEGEGEGEQGEGGASPTPSSLARSLFGEGEGGAGSGLAADAPVVLADPPSPSFSLAAAAEAAGFGAGAVERAAARLEEQRRRSSSPSPSSPPLSFWRASAAAAAAAPLGVCVALGSRRQVEAALGEALADLVPAGPPPSLFSAPAGGVSVVEVDSAAVAAGDFAGTVWCANWRPGG